MPVVIQRVDVELTIKNGEILTLLSKEQENFGYWLAYSEDGRVGHIPSNFVEVSLGLYIDAVIIRDVARIDKKGGGIRLLASVLLHARS